jgi:hypothetical protein
VRGQKMALLVLRSVGYVCRGKTKCAICGSAIKLVLKNVRWKKIKNTGLAMSVGLLVVRLKYGLYVGHLSKWFVLVLMFNF